jgi:hypothetical protein
LTPLSALRLGDSHGVAEAATMVVVRQWEYSAHRLSAMNRCFDFGHNNPYAFRWSGNPNLGSVILHS